MRWRAENAAWRLLRATPMVWAAALIVIPAALVAATSLTNMSSVIAALRAPPGDFTPDLSAWARLFTNPLYGDALASSLLLATTSTLLTLLIAYPLSLAIARSPAAWRLPLLFLVSLPFWTSFLVRVYSWMTLLSDTGLINSLLMQIGLIEQPLALMRSSLAVHIGIAYSYLPFMILPIYAVLAQEDAALTEAAADLGAHPAAQFLQVTLPLSLPGVAAGTALVFVPVLGEYVIPELLGSPETLTLGRMIWIEFYKNQDWPQAAAIAMLLTLLVLAASLLVRRMQMGRATP